MFETLLLEEKLFRLEKAASDFKAEGGNKVLFWAGRLSNAALDVIQSDTYSLSDRIKWLNEIRQKYDEEIMKMPSHKVEVKG